MTPFIAPRIIMSKAGGTNTLRGLKHAQMRMIKITKLIKSRIGWIGKSSIHPIRDFINFVILIIRICACFKPLSVFVPPALLMIILGAIKGVIDYSQNHHLGALSVAMALTGIQML